MRERHGGEADPGTQPAPEPAPEPTPDPAPEPGRPRQLDRAPGERYRARPDTPGASGDAGGGAPATAAGTSPALRAAAPFLVAIAGALLVAVLGSFDIGSGLLAVSAFVGWAVGLAIVWGGTPGSRGGTPGSRGGTSGDSGRTGAWSAGLAAASIVLGFVLLWAWSRVEGGAMDPVAYLDARFGPVAYLDIAVAAVVAWLRAH